MIIFVLFLISFIPENTHTHTHVDLLNKKRQLLSPSNKPGLDARRYSLVTSLVKFSLPQRNSRSIFPVSKLIFQLLTVIKTLRRERYLYFLLEDDDAAALVSRGQQLPCVVELHRGDDVGWKHNRT